MAHFGGSQMQGPPTGLCDYCHQKPKFPPYDYCGKACGSRAKTTGSMPSNGPVLCKQCGQRPVHQGHQFCGRTCANTWRGMYGQIGTGGYGQPQHGQQSRNSIPPLQYPPSNPIQPLQGPNQGGAIRAIIMALKGLLQSQKPGPPNRRHILKQRSAPGKKSGTMGMAMDPQMDPTDSGGIQSSHDPNFDPHAYADPNQGLTATSNHYFNSNHLPGQDQNTGGPASVQVQAQTQFSIQVTSPPAGAGGDGSEDRDPNDRNHFPSQQLAPTSSGPLTICRFKGCNKPVSVDPVTHQQSEYCTQGHLEDAKISGQDPCIMCMRMPRGLTDHFCSKACRDKALSP